MTERSTAPIALCCTMVCTRNPTSSKLAGVIKVMFANNIVLIEINFMERTRDDVDPMTVFYAVCF